ncbi:putative mitochondrial protein [Vitis vinifera]|uniref:Putative mitochondrial protein n=1 Tax=Vitis vinifera TaxID=29760 RepID=A0A438FCL5_VITVI|nr:putative mitochondrial protein [Vitis vinifera]
MEKEFVAPLCNNTRQLVLTHPMAISLIANGTNLNTTQMASLIATRPGAGVYESTTWFYQSSVLLMFNNSTKPSMVLSRLPGHGSPSSAVHFLARDFKLPVLATLCLSITLQLGISSFRADNSMFIHHTASHFLILLIYVDDIFITGSNSSHVSSLFLIFMHFALRDLGDLHYFLDIEVLQTDTALHLNQHSKQGLRQFMAAPTSIHWLAVKSILRYLKGTSYGIHMQKSSSLDIHAYTDADRASCPNDRRSTSGYYIFLSLDLVHGPLQSRKSFLEVALSFEYRGIAAKTSEIIWIQSILHQTKDLGKLKYFLGKCGYVTKEVCLRHLGRNSFRTKLSIVPKPVSFQGDDRCQSTPTGLPPIRNQNCPK